MFFCCIINLEGDNMTAQGILEKLVSFNTIKDKQNSDINKYIKEYLEELVILIQF